MRQNLTSTDIEDTYIIWYLSFINVIIHCINRDAQRKSTKSHWKNLRISGTSNKKPNDLEWLGVTEASPHHRGGPFLWQNRRCAVWNQAFDWKDMKQIRSHCIQELDSSHLLKSGAGVPVPIEFNWVQLMKQSLTHFVLLKRWRVKTVGRWTTGSPHLRHGGWKKSCLCRGSSPMMWWWKMRINRHVVPNTLNPMVSRPSPRP